jgi:protein-disulfide isomerase
MKNEWFLPGAIIVAGIIIAISVYSVHHAQLMSKKGNPEAARPIDATDHVIGNPAAPVVVIEYGDIDSRYTKDFDLVMTQIMDAYGSSGNVAWVFRHFPLVVQNQYSEQHAEAAECVAAQGGTTMFYKFIDSLQATSPDENQFNPAGYDDVVSGLGLDVSKFNLCIKGHTYEKHVAGDFNNALEIGAEGSPYSVLLVKGQKPRVISGSLPYNAMKQVIDQAIHKVLAQ